MEILTLLLKIASILLLLTLAIAMVFGTVLLGKYVIYKINTDVKEWYLTEEAFTSENYDPNDTRVLMIKDSIAFNETYKKLCGKNLDLDDLFAKIETKLDKKVREPMAIMAFALLESNLSEYDKKDFVGAFFAEMMKTGRMFESIKYQYDKTKKTIKMSDINNISTELEANLGGPRMFLKSDFTEIKNDDTYKFEISLNNFVNALYKVSTEDMKNNKSDLADAKTIGDLCSL